MIAGRVGEFRLRHVELLEELLVRRGLFERVELHPVDVLQEGVAKHGRVGGLSDDRGNGVESGKLAGPPATLAHDDLELGLLGLRILGPRFLERLRPHIIADGADDDRLHESELADRMREFPQGIFVEDLTRLTRVRNDERDGDLTVRRADVRGPVSDAGFGGLLRALRSTPSRSATGFTADGSVCFT